MPVDFEGLARLGFSVFPLTPGSKKPFAPWARFQRELPTADELKAWQRQSRDNKLNGAIACGAISGIIVLDTDNAEADAEVQRRGVPETARVKTAKGTHYYFQHPGRPVRNFARKIEGVDLRGDGGYVVAPGSIHPSGHVYQWIAVPGIEAIIADAPDWLLELVDGTEQPALAPVPTLAPETKITAGPAAAKPAKGARKAPASTPAAAAPTEANAYAEKALDEELSRVRRAPEGTRNDSLNRAAFNLGQLVAGGALGRLHVERQLLFAGLAVGLVQKECEATIKSGLDDGAQHPRTAPEPRSRSRGTSPPRPPDDPDGRASGGGGRARGGPSTPGRGEGCPFTALGQWDGVYYLLGASGQVRPMAVRELNWGGILSLCNGDARWLAETFPTFRMDRDTGELVTTGDWQVKRAAAWIMAECAAAGLYDLNTTLRGPGVWRDGTGIAVHVGERVMIGGAWRPAGFRSGDVIYVASSSLSEPAPAPATEDQVRGVIDDLALWRFKTPMGRAIVFGWLSAALLGAAPRWRPHILLSGGRGSGKSTLVELIGTALGDQAQTINTFSEAGLRQLLTGEARGLLLDEAEGTVGRVEIVIKELIRLMSDGEGARGVRGTADHKSKSFTVSGPVLMSAINAPQLEPQDRSRITEVEILTADASNEGRVRAAIERIAALSPALRARAVAGWDRFLANVAMIRSVLVESGCDGRQSDQIGALLAAGDMMLKDAPIDADSARLIVDKIEPLLFRLRAEDEEDTDGRRCFGVLMSTQVDHWQKGTKSTLGHILGHALLPGADGLDARKALAVYGMRVELDGVPLKKREKGQAVEVQMPGPVLLVASNHQALSKLFRDTRWREGWARSLVRLPGAEEAPPLHYAGHKARGVAIPGEQLPPPATQLGLPFRDEVPDELR